MTFQSTKFHFEIKWKKNSKRKKITLDFARKSILIYSNEHRRIAPRSIERGLKKIRTIKFLHDFQKFQGTNLESRIESKILENWTKKMKKIENRVESRTMILQRVESSGGFFIANAINESRGWIFHIFFSIKRDKSCAMTLGERESTIR